jgi:hypothetical protein
LKNVAGFTFSTELVGPIYFAPVSANVCCHSNSDRVADVPAGRFGAHRFGLCTAHLHKIKKHRSIRAFNPAEIAPDLRPCDKDRDPCLATCFPGFRY